MAADSPEGLALTPAVAELPCVDAGRKIEQRRSCQRLIKWRTGSEGRISCLKRDFGWNRTRIDSLCGARTWCGHGVFNHNLIKIAALTNATTP